MLLLLSKVKYIAERKEKKKTKHVFVIHCQVKNGQTACATEIIHSVINLSNVSEKAILASTGDSITSPSCTQTITLKTMFLAQIWAQQASVFSPPSPSLSSNVSLNSLLTECAFHPL